MKSTQKIIVGLLSLAMVLTVVGVAATQTNAQTASFTRNLTVGSRGADVTELQTILAEGSFLSVEPTGYFGSLTKAAVKAWQASVGVSATGYFGPLSRAAIGGTAVTPVTPGCSAGAKFNSVTGAPCTSGTSTVPGCAAGALFSSTTGASCTGGSTGGALDNTDGSITASLSSYAGDTTIKKGESKSMIAVKLQATAGKVAVSRFDVRINVRPWLYFSKITLKDTDGTVIAAKNLTGASDVTEVAVASDYLARFEGLNYVIAPGADKTLVVEGTVLTTTDKLSSDVPVSVTVPAGSIRTVNGKGFTDSVGVSSGRTITLSSTGSTANIVARISPSTSLTKIQTTSTSGQTNDVILAVYDLKSQNQASTLNTFKVTLNDSSGNKPWTAALKNLRLTDGTNTYNVDAVATTSIFSNLNIALPLDSWKSLTLKADVADQDDFTSGMVASTSISATNVNIVATDSNYNPATVSAGTAASNDITFLAAGVNLSGISATLGSAVVQNNYTTGYTGTYKFTVTNNGDTDVFVAKLPGTMLATSSALSTGGSTASSTISSVNADPDPVPGDTTLAYKIPSNGSRTFTFTGRISPIAGGGAQTANLKITNVYFGTDATSYTTLRANNISFGLGSLSLNSQF